ncbi:MAG: Beta-barrel assembly-enhancing protease [Phycisphaerae bacterium]|nr:Beta-barrel assembly-enhancing protease [Phycisphaerae bacterium]
MKTVTILMTLLLTTPILLAQVVQRAALDSADKARIDPAKAEQAEKDYDAGRKLYFQGQYKDAAAKLAAAVAANPTKSDYRLLLAKARIRLGQPAEGVELLESILKENPEHVEAGVTLAEQLSAEKNHKRVIAVLEPLLKFKHDYPLYHMLAIAHYETEDLAKARGEFEEAVKLNPSSGDDWYLLGNIYLGESRFAKAAGAYEQANGLGVDSAVLHFKLASVYFNLRNYLGRVGTSEVIGGKAGQVRNNMYLIDPVPGRKDVFYVSPNDSAIYQVARAREMGVDATQLGFLEARIWLSARRYAKADALYKTLEGKLPKADQGLFWFYWARTALGLEDYDAYIARLNEAIKVEPDTYKPTLADAYVTVATRYQQRGDGAKYIEFLTKAVQTSPLSAGLHLTLGEALWQAGQRPAAAEQYRLVLELEPDHAQRVELLNRIREVQEAQPPAPEAKGK